MNKKTEFTKNTILLLIGKFCTQFITFFLLPIFTRYLLPGDYGYVDLMQSYISLLVPVLILRLDSAIFRFLIDARKDDNKSSKLVSTTSFIIFIQILLLYGVD